MTFFKMSIYARSGRLGLPHESLPCISARFWSVPSGTLEEVPALEVHESAYGVKHPFTDRG